MLHNLHVMLLKHEVGDPQSWGGHGVEWAEGGLEATSCH